MKKLALSIAMVLMIISSAAFAQSSQVLDYLYKISGKRTLAGQHNKEPNAGPHRQLPHLLYFQFMQRVEPVHLGPLDI